MGAGRLRISSLFVCGSHSSSVTTPSAPGSLVSRLAALAGRPYEYETCGKKELKVLLALNPGGSISGVTWNIDENRETIRRVVNPLEDAGFITYDGSLQLADQPIRDAGLEFLTTAAVSPPSALGAYVLPQFVGMDYAFTAIDAVYV